jgi:transcriptional regulator of heat shock response
MNITERQYNILKAIIREYVKNVKPVSSKWLKERYDFNINPPSIRIEMQRLAEKGYITQPHTSAGRIPTDKGYRLFVNELIEKFFPKIENINVFKMEDWDYDVEDLYNFVKNLAEKTEVLVILSLEKDNILFKEGWERVLKNPEFSKYDVLNRFTYFLNDFQDYLQEMILNKSIEIYIGKENPFKGATDFSLIVTKCCVQKDNFILSLVGPKRMSYDKNIMLIKKFLWNKIKIMK